MSPPADESADALYPVVYDELRRLAHHHRRNRAASETLSTTALVHEAYLRLSEGDGVRWSDRAHFLALASRAMRFVLIDEARARNAEKRGGGVAEVSLDDAVLAAEDRSADLLAIDQALRRLEQHDPRLARLVQLRFFGGLSYEEVAEVVELSVPTVKRDWARARAWLHRFMAEERA